jgi:hypothetical protein
MYGYTDVTVVLAIATALVTTAFAGIIASTVQTKGKHGWDIPKSVMRSPTTQKTGIAEHTLNAASLWLGKFCLLTMYYRIFGHTRKVRWQLIGTAILTLPLFAAIIIRPIMVGPPPGKPWGTRNEPIASYTDAIGLMMGVDNTLVDFCILYIPIPVILGLNLSDCKRKGVLALFATGSM